MRTVYQKPLKQFMLTRGETMCSAVFMRTTGTVRLARGYLVASIAARACSGLARTAMFSVKFTQRTVPPEST